MHAIPTDESAADATVPSMMRKYFYIAIAVPWQVALFVLLQRFKFTLHPGHVVDLKAKIILTPKYGMVMDIADR
jgi:hypothetical protein